ncbi:MAG: endolytic transglycosylase MltG, partial [Muribaculaceae bacterium]|nr:endolytic transglycosylase MltG [Muribaculaceae bacterium]
MKKRPLLWALLLLAALIFSAGIWAWSQANAKYEYEPVRVNIRAGWTEQQIDSCLRADLGTSYGARVARIWRLAGSEPRLAHGSYLVQPGTRAWHLARTLRNGRQTPVRVTFNNLRLTTQLADRVASQLEFSADDFLAAADSLLPQRGYKSRAEYPAAFLPDSYEFYWTASPAHVVKTLADHRDAFWTDARRSRAAELGLTPVQVATVASIAEEETADRAERGTVARLYLNRIHRGMKLQADPTVKYAVGDFSLRRITGRHLGVASPYNTYLHEGLPPGPIRI